jgi:hypothetical protein
VKVSLEISHQQSGGNAFPHDVADHQPELVPAKLKKIVKIPANVAGLDANSRIFQGRKSGPFLWEKSGLYLPGKFQLLARAVFGFEPLRMNPALLLHFASDLLATEKRKRIAVHVFEGRGNGAPGMRLRRTVKTDATLAPFLELGKHVFGQKDNPGGRADEFVFV